MASTSKDDYREVPLKTVNEHITSLGKNEIDINMADENMASDKTKPPMEIPLEGKFIPEEIMLSLTNLPQSLPSTGKKQLKLPPGTKKVMKKPSNVWNHQERRKFFQYLTDYPPSLSGAGRDISFLYDMVEDITEMDNSSHLFDKSSIRTSTAIGDIKQVQKQEQNMNLPESLISSEYHLLNSRGLKKLQYQDKKFTTHLVNSEGERTTFPSMNPSSRFEVLQLKLTLDEMLEKAGINDEEVEIKGPSQLHNLLELIKKEQNIYNIVFHELIRQVSVECIERGELLQCLRQRYSLLLDKVPRQVKSLHQEVMAQRALDRRLTEELLRFKSSIATLTSELSDVKEHDRLVTKQALQAQENLSAALAESEKNASLLSEYHELYELQRKRLEEQIVNLHEESELWSNACYSLALKIIDSNSLSTAKRLHICEKAWSKLTRHFTIVLSDKDTEELSKLQNLVEKFHKLTRRFNEELNGRNKKFHTNLLVVRKGILKWKQYFSDFIVIPKETTLSDSVSTSFRFSSLSNQGPDNTIKIPDLNVVKNLFEDIRNWEEILNKEIEQFGGDILLSSEEKMKAISQQVEGWTEIATNVFRRHLNYGSASMPQLEHMHLMNKECDKLLQGFNVLITGENGSAKGLIAITNAMELWDTKLSQTVNGGVLPPESEWYKLYKSFDDWVDITEETCEILNSMVKEDEKEKKLNENSINMENIFKKTQKWLTTSVSGVDSEDAKLLEQVNIIHSKMVLWMIRVLMRLAPDVADASPEIIDGMLSLNITLDDIKEEAHTIFERITSFSNYLTNCCVGIVTDEIKKKQEIGIEDDGHELRDLKKIKVEADEWVHISSLLLEEMLGFSEDNTTEQHDSKEKVNVTTNIDEMKKIGYDENIHIESLEQTDKPMTNLKRIIDASNQENTLDTKRAYEALTAVSTLQSELLQTEERAQSAEERVSELEQELKLIQEKVRSLERQSTTPSGNDKTIERINASELQDEKPAETNIRDISSPKKAVSRTSSQSSVKSMSSSKSSKNLKKK